MRIIQYTPNTRSLSPALGVFSRSPWTGFESEIDRWLNTALSGAATAQFPVDVYEDKENAYVRAQLPGVKREEITVELVEDSLTIAASRKPGTGQNDESFSLSQSVSLPEDVQADKVSAAYENGVLTVTLPKREEEKPKKITIEVK